MEIKTLVYIGVFLIIVSISFNVYLSWDKIKKLINHQNDSKNFEVKVKDDLNKITRTINNELNNNKPVPKSETKPVPKPESEPEIESKLLKTSDIDKEIDKLNKDLKKLENEILREENNLSSVAVKPKKNAENVNNHKEVYLVKSNIFRKTDANNVCKALFNGDVATKSQIKTASDEGANWCNYGWADDNNAYYPLSEDTSNNVCSGTKGLNGGNFPDSDNFKLGINCFGIKPEEKAYGSLDRIYNMDMFNEYERNSLEKYKKKLNKGAIKIEPYNPNQWSKYNFKKDTITINNSTVITTSKTDNSKDPLSIKVEKNKLDAIIKTD